MTVDIGALRTFTVLVDRAGFGLGSYDNSQSFIDSLRNDLSGLEVLNNAGQVIGAISSINPVTSLVGNSLAVSITLNKALNEGLTLGDVLSIAGNVVAMLGAATVIGAATVNPFTVLGFTAAGFAIGLTQLSLNEAERNKKIAPEVNTAYQSAQNWQPPRDPFVLDLDGDGIETVGISGASPVLFDHDADGIRTGTGWIKADDGLLLLDLNGNGTIDSGRELFGDNTQVPAAADGTAQTAANGYQALQQHDTNADGQIDSQDAVYSQLRVWQDTNQDGISQAGEMRTLAQLGIASIGVQGTETNTNLGQGNSQIASGTFTRADGTSGASGVAELSGSLLLASNNFFGKFTDNPSNCTAAQGLLNKSNLNGEIYKRRRLRKLLLVAKISSACSRSSSNSLAEFLNGMHRINRLKSRPSLQGV
jgi:hypothetical protein